MMSGLIVWEGAQLVLIYLLKTLMNFKYNIPILIIQFWP